MTSRRELRVRVLEALERLVKQFRIREELFPLRVPPEPVSLDAVIAEAVGQDQRFDESALRARSLLRLEWGDGGLWDLWVIALPSGLKLFCDSDGDESRVLASGGRNMGDDSDRLFLERLAESAGSDFGIEMTGGAPIRVRSPIADRPFLVDTFTTLFEGTDVEDTIRAAVEHDANRTAGGADGRDFREEVRVWLDQVAGRSAPS